VQDNDCINACRQLHLWSNDNLVDLAMPASMQAANPTSLEFLARRVPFLTELLADLNSDCTSVPHQRLRLIEVLLVGAMWSCRHDVACQDGVSAPVLPSGSSADSGVLTPHTVLCSKHVHSIKWLMPKRSRPER